MRIAVDLDGVLANWGGEWDKHAAGHEHHGLTLSPDQTTFDLYANATPTGRQIINSIMNMPGFYAALEPMPGAREAMNLLLELGHDVRIVTAPWPSNTTCASDKLAWTEAYLGEGWAKRTVITSDKTLVRSDILVDDKPSVTGSMTPEWVHVYYDQPYNQGLRGRRIYNWTDGTWLDIIQALDGAFRAVERELEFQPSRLSLRHTVSR